jgi:hypothetical protein
MRHTHFQILPNCIEEAAPAPRLQKIKLAAPVQGLRRPLLMNGTPVGCNRIS